MRGVVIAVLALLVAVACGSAGATPSGDEARKRPALSIASVDPLTVNGKRFVAHERVKLLVGSPAPRTKAARADARGRFTVSFKIGAERCASVVVQAIGSRGSRALVDVTALACASLGSPPGGYHPPGERP